MIRTGLKYGLFGVGVSLGQKAMKNVRKGRKHN